MKSTGLDATSTKQATDASFTAACYASLPKDDPNQKYIYVKKSYTTSAYN